MIEERVSSLLANLARVRGVIDFRALAVVVGVAHHRDPEFRGAIVRSGLAPLVVYRELGRPGSGYFRARKCGRATWRADVRAIHDRYAQAAK